MVDVPQMQAYWANSGGAATITGGNSALLQTCMQIDLLLRDGLVKKEQDKGYWRWAPSPERPPAPPMVRLLSRTL